MPEQIEKLKAVVRELEIELRELQEVDEQASEVLREALQEIQAVLRARQLGEPVDVKGESSLADDEQGEPDSVMDRLKHSAREFEGSHPTLTGLLTRLIDGLGQMGI